MPNLYTNPDHTPPHIVGIVTVGLKKSPWSTQQRHRRNRTNKAMDYSVDHSANRPAVRDLTPVFASWPVRELTNMSATCPVRELTTMSASWLVRDLSSPRIDQSAIRLSAIWFVRQLTSNRNRLSHSFRS